MKRIFTRFTVEGLNLDRLIGTLSRRGIRLYRMRKINRKTLKFSLKNEDKQKFFAIMENMCYNVTETGEYGLGMIPALLGRHPGAVLGVFLLAFSLFFGDAVMTGVQFSGSGALYAAEAERTLEECGVRPFTFFAAYDRDELERLLLKNPHFSFASVKKEGNRLVVELALADEETPLFGEKRRSSRRLRGRSNTSSSIGEALSSRPATAWSAARSSSRGRFFRGRRNWKFPCWGKSAFSSRIPRKFTRKTKKTPARSFSRGRIGTT